MTQAASISTLPAARLAGVFLIAFSLAGVSILQAGESKIDTAALWEGSCEEGCACHCGPTWSIYLGELVLHRDTPSNSVLMENTADTSLNLNAADFDFDWRAGVEATARRQFGADRQLDIRFMQIDSWNARTTAPIDSVLGNLLRIRTAPPTFVNNVLSVDGAYGSDLISAEANLMGETVRGWHWLAGFRYIELDERLHTQLNAPPQTVLLTSGTQNRMYGFQLGAHTPSMCLGGWQVVGTGRAGIYENKARQVSILDTGVVTAPATGNANPTAFVGEIGVQGTYALSDSTAIRVGYNALWIDSAALAADQIPTLNFVTQSGIDSGGSVFYHGLNFGIELRH